MNLPQIEFGYLEDDKHTVTLFRFCADPDGSNLPWFEKTGASGTIAGRQLISIAEASNSGRCFDAGEYYSHIGKLLQNILTKAPAARLATFKTSSGASIRTFEETVHVTFYA